MRPVVSERLGRFAIRVEGFRGWPVRRVVQPLHWWLSGNTDPMWLDRYGEDADRLQPQRLCHDDRAPGPLPHSGRSAPSVGQRADPATFGAQNPAIFDAH